MTISSYRKISSGLRYWSMVVCVAALMTIVGYQYQLIGCLWLGINLLLNWWVPVWHDWLIPVAWLLGTTVDLLGGYSLGFGGSWLLLQSAVAKMLLAKHPKLRICWLVISSLGWLWYQT